MVRKLSKHIPGKLLVSILLALATSIPGALQADDYTHMIQYELRFGNKQPVSSLYLSMQPAGVGHAMQFDTGSKTMFRAPVISTDPHKITLLRPLSVLFAAEESDTSTDVGSDESTPDKTAGEHVKTAAGGILGLVLVFGPLIYAISSAASDISDIGDIDLDIPEGIEVDIPEPPPEESS